MQRSRKVAVSLIATIAMMGAVLVVAAGPASAGAIEEHKVTLCHATNAATNPYVKVTVDVHSAGQSKGLPKGGHDSHDEAVVPADFAEAQQLKADGIMWGDVIPAYNFAGFDPYPGLNLDANGIALLENDCQLPGAPEEDVPYRLVRRMPTGEVTVVKLKAGLTPNVSCDTATNEYVVTFGDDPTEYRMDVGTSRKGSILRVRSEGVVLIKVRASEVC
ncbi:MAG: hypothetical protein WD556_10875 [Actinomycetota bacterium]